jgi:hypothetical protein
VGLCPSCRHEALDILIGREDVRRPFTAGTVNETKPETPEVIMTKLDKS